MNACLLRFFRFFTRPLPVLVALFCICSSQASMAASDAVRTEDLQGILKTLSAHPLVRADFSQEKTVPALKKPLHSEGQLVFAGPQGVLLFIRKPVQAELVITQDVLLQKTARTQTRLRLDQSPYGAIAGIFGQLMSGDLERLQKTFRVESLEKRESLQNGKEGKGGTWTLRLTPRDSRLHKLISRLTVTGDDWLRELEITEPVNTSAGVDGKGGIGGSTRMTLSNPVSPASLTDAERALLELAR